MWKFCSLTPTSAPKEALQPGAYFFSPDVEPNGGALSLTPSRSPRPSPHGHRLSTSPSPNCRSSLTISIYNTGIILILGTSQHLEAFDNFFNVLKDTMSIYPPPTTSTIPGLSPNQPNIIPCPPFSLTLLTFYPHKLPMRSSTISHPPTPSQHPSKMLT